jgi:V/A-type H+-transporting ATPase subunit F
MYKIGIIGDRGSVMGYMALGFQVFEATTPEEASEVLHGLCREESYAAISIVEDLAAQMEDAVARYKDKPLPAIVAVPGQKGRTGYGTESIRSAVERAVGVDLFFKD